MLERISQKGIARNGDTDQTEQHPVKQGQTGARPDEPFVADAAGACRSKAAERVSGLAADGFLAHPWPQPVAPV